MNSIPENSDSSVKAVANDALLADSMRNYDPKAPEKAEIEKVRSEKMRALSQEEIEERQRANAHLMVNAYSSANTQGLAHADDNQNNETNHNDT